MLPSSRSYVFHSYFCDDFEFSVVQVKSFFLFLVPSLNIYKFELISVNVNACSGRLGSQGGPTWGVVSICAHRRRRKAEVEEARARSRLRGAPFQDASRCGKGRRPDPGLLVLDAGGSRRLSPL